MNKITLFHGLFSLFYCHLVYSQNNKLEKDTLFVKVKYYSTGEILAIDSFIGDNRIGTTITYYKNGNTKSIGYCILLSKEKKRVRSKDSVPYIEDICTNCIQTKFDSMVSNRQVYSGYSLYSEEKDFVDELYENGQFKVKHRTYYTDGLLLMIELQYDLQGCINKIKLYQWLDNKYIKEFGRIWSGWKLLN